jgi:hypothetical protein
MRDGFSEGMERTRLLSCSDLWKVSVYLLPAAVLKCGLSCLQMKRVNGPLEILCGIKGLDTGKWRKSVPSEAKSYLSRISKSRNERLGWFKL